MPLEMYLLPGSADASQESAWPVPVTRHLRSKSSHRKYWCEQEPILQGYSELVKYQRNQLQNQLHSFGGRVLRQSGLGKRLWDYAIFEASKISLQPIKAGTLRRFRRERQKSKDPRALGRFVIVFSDLICAICELRSHCSWPASWFEMFVDINNWRSKFTVKELAS